MLCGASYLFFEELLNILGQIILFRGKKSCIDYLEADVTVSSLSAVHAFWWQQVEVYGQNQWNDGPMKPAMVTLLSMNLM